MKPLEENRIIPWSSLSTRSMTSLRWTMARLDIPYEPFRVGFTYEMLQQISLYEVFDTKNVGEKRANDLLAELKEIFGSPPPLPEPSQITEVQEEESLEMIQKYVITNAKNLQELVNGMIEILAAAPKMDDKKLAIVVQRLPAISSANRTLESIAQEWGVTRERIRQIVDKWNRFTFPIHEDIVVLSSILTILRDSKSEEDFYSILEETQFLGGAEISLSQLESICSFFEKTELKLEIDKQREKWLEADEQDSELRKEIKKLRSPLGLYDLDHLQKRFKNSKEILLENIEGLYPRTIKAGDLVLARTRNLDTMVENSLAKQLFVSNYVKPTELIVGLERTASYRGTPLIGSKKDLLELISILTGTEPSFEYISSKLLKPIQLQTLENWLVDVFSNSSNSLLHSNELVSFALRDGINVSSLQVYLVNSPIIRGYGGSVFSLVGAHPETSEIERHRKIVLSSGRNTEINYEMNSNGIKLLVVPNLNVVTSGIIFPPHGLKQMMQGYTFESKCSCGELSSQQYVKFAPSGFWTGFTAMIRHGMNNHQLRQNSKFEFNFDFDANTVTLNVGN